MVDQVVARINVRISELRAKQGQLAEEIEQITHELERLQIGLSVCQEHSGEPASETEETAAPPAQGSEFDASVLPQGIRQVDLVLLVRPIILDHGQPMQFKEVFNAVKKTGRHIGGTKEDKNLRTKLDRARKEIAYISGAGYWPVDVPCPRVNYVPPKSADAGQSAA